MTKQKKALKEDELSTDKVLSSKKKFIPKNATFFERKLALDKTLSPSAAASKALFGVTLVSVTSCCVLVGGIAAALGVTNVRASAVASESGSVMLFDFLLVILCSGRSCENDCRRHGLRRQ